MIDRNTNVDTTTEALAFAKPMLAAVFLSEYKLTIKKIEMEKKLGKIVNVSFGIGGYQDAMIGLHVTLGNNGWGVGDSRSAWDAESVKWSEKCKWTEFDRDKQYAELLRYLSKLLKDAKVDSVDKLKGIPVEVTFEGNMLKEWRVLTEVL